MKSKPKLSFALAIIAFAFVSSLGYGQSMFFHLLGTGDLLANFTSAAQTINESTGTYGVWPNALSGWSYRRRILFEGASSGDVTDFAALVKLNSTRFTYANSQAAGQDIRFADDAGNLLPYEIESWNASGDSFLWVKLPTYKAYPARTSLWVYYGNASATDAQTPATVWTSTQNKVFHFNGTAGATILNTAVVKASLGTDGTASNGGSGMSFAAGLTGTGITFDGIDDWIDVGGDSNLNFGANTPLTMSAMVKTTDNAGPLIIFRDLATGSNILGIYIGANGANYTAGRVNILTRDAGDGTYGEILGPVVNDDAWHDVAITRNAGDLISLFVDGVAYGTVSSPHTGGPFTTDLRSIGSDRKWVADLQNAPDLQYLSGTIDEVRVSGMQHTVDYFAAKYQTALDRMAHYGAEENPNLGLASVIVGLGGPATTSVMVPYTVSGTATSMLDHTGASGSITIATGQSSGAIPVRILRDTLVESDETAIFTLGTPTGVPLGTRTVHTITITDEVEAAPDAVDDSINITSLNAVTLPVLANDTDSNADLLTITAFTAPTAGGTLTKVGADLVYTPSEDFSATDTFTYTISDGRGGSDTATVTLNMMIPFTWIGAGADANWQSVGNWRGGVVPGPSDTAYFNDQCAAQCSPIISAPIAMAGLRLNSAYAGTVAQNSQNVTLNSTGFKLRGGTFSASTGQLKLLTGDFIVKATGTFTAGSGTLYHACALQARCVIEPSTGNYANVKIQGNQSAFDLSAAAMNVNTSLSMGDTGGPTYTSQHVDNGTFNLKGNYVVTDYGVRGNAVVKMLPSGSSRTITGLAGMFMPNLTIDAGVNTVSLIGDIGVANTYKYISGTLSTGSSTLRVFCDFGLECTFEPGTQSYYKVTLASDGGNYNLVGGTLNVSNLLTIGDTRGATFVTQHIRNGTINANGSISISPYGYIGDVVINARGSTSTLAVGSPAGVPEGTFSVNKTLPSITLTLASNVNFAGAGQAVNVTKGIVDLAGNNLNVAGLLTVGPGGQVICNGGLLTAGSTAITGQLNCGSSLGITWVGNTGDGLWTTAGNWYGGVVPGASDLALFNSICGSNCNVSIPSNISVRGVTMTASYSGTITQATGATITVGSGGWNQYAGTFVGSNAAITMTDHFLLSAGTYTATSASMSLGSQECGSKEVLTVTGGTFNHGNGRLVIQQGRGAGYPCDSVAQLNFPSGFTVYDLEMNAISQAGGWVSSTQPMNADTINVAGSFYDYGHELKFHLNISGNLYLENTNNDRDSADPSGIMNLVGAGAQSYTSSGATTSTRMKIAKASGTVTPSAGTTNLTLYGLEVAQGFFKAPSGNLTLGKQVSFTTTMDSLKVAAAATYDVNGSTTRFAMRRSSTSSANATGNVNVPAAFVFNNVELIGESPGGGWYDYITSNNDLTVAGNLVLNGHVNQANWKVAGNLTVKGPSFGGDGIITLNGSTNQSITGVVGAYLSKLVINSSGGTVSMNGVICTFNDWTYTSGVVNPGASEVRFDSSYRSMTLSAGTMSFNILNLHGYVGTLNINGIVDVLGMLSISGDSVSPYYELLGGTIKAHGNVLVDSSGANGTTVLQMAGSTNQTLTGASSLIPAVEINSTGGTVSLVGTLRVRGAYTHTQGTVDAGTSTLNFESATDTYAIVPGPTNFNNVSFSGYASVYNISAPVKVGGTLALNGSSTSPPQQINSGALEASGNVIFSGYGAQGTSPLKMLGATATSLSIASGATQTYGTVSIAKTSGAIVSLAQDSSFNSSGQDLTVTSGVFDLAGHVLTVNDVLTVASGATLRCSDGSFTSASVVNSGTIDCPGYAAYGFNWTGGTGDGKWSTAGNWSGGAVPTSVNTVIFQDDFCGTHCNSNIDVAADVKGVFLRVPYSGQLRQTTGVTVNVGTRGWGQDAGTFSGGNSNFTVNGPFSLSGGSFAATSAISAFKGNFAISNSPVFDNGNGLMTFDDDQTLIPNGITAKNVRFGGTTSQNLSGGTLNVSGNLELSDPLSCCASGLSSGTINVKGNVTITNYGKVGSTVIRLNGTASQTVTSNVNGRVPGLQFASTGGTVTLNGNIAVDSTFNYTSGTINSAGSTLIFQNAQTLTPNGVTLANVKFAGTTGQSLGGQTMNVSTLLTMDSTAACCNGDINTGTLNVTGNVVATGYGKGGNANLKMAGNTNQTVTGGTNAHVPKFEIASTGGTVTFVDRIYFMNDFKWTSGSIVTTGSYFTFGVAQSITGGTAVYDDVTFNNNTIQDLNGGNFIVRKLTIDSPAGCCSNEINNGTLRIEGDLIVTGYGKVGNAGLEWTGANNRNVTQAAGAHLPTGSRAVSSTTGTITQTTPAVFEGSNSFTITNGTWNMAGFGFTTSGALINNGTLSRGASPACGTITAGSYSGNPAICP